MSEEIISKISAFKVNGLDQEALNRFKESSALIMKEAHDIANQIKPKTMLIRLEVTSMNLKCKYCNKKAIYKSSTIDEYYCWKHGIMEMKNN